MIQRAPLHDTMVALRFRGSSRPSRVDGAHTLLGFAPEELLSGTVDLGERIHPQDAPLWAEIFSAKEPFSGSVCLRFRHADGRIRCLRAEYRSTATASPEIDLTLRDVDRSPPDTSRFSQTCRSILENSDEAMFFMNRDHVFTGVSAPFLQVARRNLGCDDPVGLTDYDIVPEEQADRYYEIEKAVLADGVPRQHVHEFVTPAGVIWILAKLFPVHSDTGEIEGVFAITQNLTDVLLNEERVTESSDLVTGSAKTAEVGTYVFDIARGTFATSSNLDSVLGIDANFPRNLQGWDSLIYPADRATCFETLQQTLDVPGRVFSLDYRIIRPCDGELRFVHGIGRVERNAEGKPLLMRGTIHDITEAKHTEAALRETKERLQLFIEHAPAALAMFDRDMRYLAISQRWRQTYEVGEEDLIGRRHYDVIPDIPERWRELHRRSLAGESLRSDEDRFDRASGSTLWIRWEMLPWHTSDGSVGGIILFIEDITRMKQAEEGLHLAATVFDQASESIAVMDTNGAILRVNHAFTRISGYSREEISERHVELLKPENGAPSLDKIIGRFVAAHGRWRGELWVRAKDGHVIPVISTVTTVHGADGNAQYYVAMFFDVSPMKEQERKLEHVVRHDALTGLPNRLLLVEHLREEIEQSRCSGHTLAVVAFDLDDFKEINDRAGKVAADSLLMNIANRLKDALREEDTLARPGGDEFVAVLSNLPNAESAKPILERLLNAIAEPLQLPPAEWKSTATAGATFFPQSEDMDADQLLRQAEQAMYEGKLAGKNRVHFYDPVRDYSLRGRHGKLQEIEQALKNEELELYYQPKVNMSTGELMGAEALIRWNHPRNGLLGPGAFLPTIEDHDLAISVGEWAVRSALRQIAAWNAAGHSIRVSVNVSARHLQQQDFVPRLEAMLAANPDADQHCLALEILETSTLQDVSHVSHIIEACTQMGIRVAIDDFGTGYSSLSYLKRLPAPVLKIDQSFVRDMLHNPDDLAILQGIMGLATAFRRIVVADGVETVEQGVMLLKLGCEIAQGYGIARPMPPDELLGWAVEWRPPAEWKHVMPVSPADWPVLIAQSELRVWTRHVEAWLHGEGVHARELDETQCRIGLWLAEEKNNPRRDFETMRLIEKLHVQAHDRDWRAVRSWQQGQLAAALASAHEGAEIREQMKLELDGLLMARSR